MRPLRNPCADHMKRCFKLLSRWGRRAPWAPKTNSEVPDHLFRSRAPFGVRSAPVAPRKQKDAPGPLQTIGIHCYFCIGPPKCGKGPKSASRAPKSQFLGPETPKCLFSLEFTENSKRDRVELAFPSIHSYESEGPQLTTFSMRVVGE